MTTVDTAGCPIDPDQPPPAGGADSPYEQAQALHRQLIVTRGWQPGGIALSFVADVLDALRAQGLLTTASGRRVAASDAADAERLAAWLINHGHHGAVIDADGNPVTAAIAVLDRAEYTRQQALNTLPANVRVKFVGQDT